MGSGSYDVTCNCSYSFCWNVSSKGFSLSIIAIIYLLIYLWYKERIIVDLFFLWELESCSVLRKLIDQLTVPLLQSGYWKTVQSQRTWIGKFSYVALLILDILTDIFITVPSNFQSTGPLEWKFSRWMCHNLLQRKTVQSILIDC